MRCICHLDSLSCLVCHTRLAKTSCPVNSTPIIQSSNGKTCQFWSNPYSRQSKPFLGPCWPLCVRLLDSPSLLETLRHSPPSAQGCLPVDACQDTRRNPPLACSLKPDHTPFEPFKPPTCLQRAPDSHQAISHQPSAIEPAKASSKSFQYEFPPRHLSCATDATDAPDATAIALWPSCRYAHPKDSSSDAAPAVSSPWPVLQPCGFHAGSPSTNTSAASTHAITS